MRWSACGNRLDISPSSRVYLELLVRKNFRLIYRKTDEVCYIVTVRRCSMLLDDNAMSELNSVE